MSIKQSGCAHQWHGDGAAAVVAVAVVVVVAVVVAVAFVLEGMRSKMLLSSFKAFRANYMYHWVAIIANYIIVKNFNNRSSSPCVGLNVMLQNKA